MNRSERDKMLEGDLYRTSDPKIRAELAAIALWLARYNGARPAERHALLAERLGGRPVRIGRGIWTGGATIRSGFAKNAGGLLYRSGMTELMEKALDAVRRRPRERQDEAAEMLLALDRLGGSTYVASDDELAAIDEVLAQAKRGAFASDAEVEAAFARFRK